MILLFSALSNSLEIHDFDFAQKTRYWETKYQDQQRALSNRRRNRYLIYFQFFHRIIRKSGSHEIPKRVHLKTFKEAARILKSDGLFVDLGIMFDRGSERDEFMHVTRKKDSLAGLTYLTKNRYFLTTNEYYRLLQDAAFPIFRTAFSFNYNISINTAANYYLKNDKKGGTFALH